MSTGEPASDTFIGRLFSRIKPGSSYAAFPWKSWDKICTILETIRGRGVRIKRSTNETQWEIDATSAATLASPHAYAVYVHNPGEDADNDLLPDAMKSDGERSVYVYAPISINFRAIAGTNCVHLAGSYGDEGQYETPVSSHWGWRRVSALPDDGVYVVYGTATSDYLHRSRFSGISLAEENDFFLLARTSGIGNQIIPIAWISAGRVVQTLCGRPWATEPEFLSVRKRVVDGSNGKETHIEIYLGDYNGNHAIRINGRNVVCDNKYLAACSDAPGWYHIQLWDQPGTECAVWLIFDLTDNSSADDGTRGLISGYGVQWGIDIRPIGVVPPYAVFNAKNFFTSQSDWERQFHPVLLATLTVNGNLSRVNTFHTGGIDLTIEAPDSVTKAKSGGNLHKSIEWCGQGSTDGELGLYGFTNDSAYDESGVGSMLAGSNPPHLLLRKYDTNGNAVSIDYLALDGLVNYIMSYIRTNALDLIGARVVTTTDGGGVSRDFLIHV